MTDMSKVIIAKSDQLNSDDLVGAPITITIRDVKIKDGGEQPVSIFYEGDNNKPYKCCKSMARVMVHAWGADAKNYIGRSMTLYRDPTVKWAGMAVGGIRISHMSHIEHPLTLALQETKGKKVVFKVAPLKSAAAPSDQATSQPASPPAGAGADSSQAPETPSQAPSAAGSGDSQRQASFTLIDGDGVEHEYPKLGDYIAGMREAVMNALDRGAVWSDNAKTFDEIMERCRNAKNGAKALAALEALTAEINEALA